MIKNKLNVYVHFIWRTYDSQPWILPAIERRVHRCVEAEAKSLECDVLEINGTDDHVHVLLALSATVPIAEVVKRMKGVSSHFFNEVLQPNAHFRWQGHYGAFSVSPYEVETVRAYIRNQKQHHADHTLQAHLESTTDELGT
jgi:REP element-mobilizing transposase RayT